MRFVEKFKRDITRHRHKAVVLAVLLAIMAVMTVRAVLQLNPKEAAAAVPIVEAIRTEANEGGIEAEERINQSKELWRRLREVRGTDVSVAFSFNSSFYMPDPSRVVQASAPERVDVAPLAPVVNADLVRRAQINAINEQAKQLSVKLTIVGNGKPGAIVNQQLLSIGDSINGFTVVAIRSGEVEFIKDGITKVINTN